MVGKLRRGVPKALGAATAWALLLLMVVTSLSAAGLSFAQTTPDATPSGAAPSRTTVANALNGPGNALPHGL